MERDLASAWHKSGWLPLLAVLVVGCVLVWIVLPTDAGPRQLKLVIDTAMTPAEAMSVWSTNLGPKEASRLRHEVSVERPDKKRVHVQLSSINQFNNRIDFWLTRSSKGLSVEGMSGTYGADGKSLWPVYDLVGTVRLSRDNLAPDPDRPLFLAFDLNGHCAGSDAPHNGFFEIPVSELR